MYTYRAVVDNVVDGDTVDLSVDLGFDVWFKTRVRLNNIDTPEKWFEYGKVVKRYVQQSLQGKEVTLTSTKQDKYGRYLVEIFLSGFRDSFNQHLVDHNMAKAYAGASRGGLWTDEELAQTTHYLLK
jgi:endonuclease YncB( thermonuclease family)